MKASLAPAAGVFAGTVTEVAVLSGGRMSSRFLLGLFDSVYVVALTAWVGSILFFSFGVAPIIFGVLGEQAGGKFVRALFPRYYLWGAIAGAIALPAFVARPLCYHEFRGPMIGAQAMVILAGILCMLYGGNSLTPAINLARDAGPSGQKRFEQLHRRAVRLNAFVLVVGLGLLVAFAIRRAPVTSGLDQLTPAGQIRYDAAIDRVIEDIEARHGMRPPRVLAPGESAELDPIVDDATVQELESLYEQKRLRDQARGRGYAPIAPSAGPGSAVQPTGPALPSSPAPAPSPSSGGQRRN
jgi:Domain of unknown function (DUF4149)